MFVAFAVGYLELELNFCFNTADSPAPSSPPPPPIRKLSDIFLFSVQIHLGSNPVPAQIPVMPFAEEAQLSTHMAPDFTIVANPKMSRRQIGGDVK